MFEECMLGVRANVFTTNEPKGKRLPQGTFMVCQLRVVTECAVVNVHVVDSDSICGS